MIFLKSQIYNIHNIKWNYLIILDACRYDYLKSIWIYNKVYKVKSPSSVTYRWLEKVFPDKYPYYFYSANPFINSLNIGTWDYNANEHFIKVIDLSKFGWDNNYGTVLPETVYDYCQNAKLKSIIWFLQPHYPYISFKSKISYKEFISNKIVENFKSYSYNEIREGYIYNLKLVIPYILKLIKVLDKPIMITSDHGELLGEYNKIGHYESLNVPELRDVPLIYIEE